MSFALLGILQSQAAGGGFTHFFANAKQGFTVYSLKADLSDDGNYYVGGIYNDEPVIAKLDSGLNILWQRELGITGNFELDCSVLPDSSGNVYVVATTKLDGTGNKQDIFIAKYNSSGSIQWQRKLFDSNTNLQLKGFVTDNGVYLAGATGNYPSDYPFIAHINTSGGTVYQKLVAQTQRVFYDIKVDSSGNAYAFGTEGFSKYNTGGTRVLHKRAYNASGQASYFQAGSVSPTNGDIVAYGLSSRWVSSGGVVIAFDSSGSQDWQYETTTGSTFYAAANVDGNGNTYGLAFKSGGLVIVKRNSSGTLVWQRKITASGLSASQADIRIVGDDFIVSARDNAFFCKLPTDGSLTGTYTVGSETYTYAAETYPFQNGGLTDTSASGSDNTTFLTNSAQSATDSASTALSITYQEI